MNRWKIMFWAPGNRPQDDGATFGCASHGFSNQTSWMDPEQKAMAVWSVEPEGRAIAGTYQHVLDELKNVDFKPAAAIAVFSKSMGMEDFIRDFVKVLGHTPLIGGGAALGPGQSSGEILPKGQEVALLLISKGGFRLDTGNIHEDTGIRVEIEAPHSRLISRIRPAGSENWEEALTFFRRQQQWAEVGENDFESLTFSDSTGRNIHCSVSEGGLKSGAELPKDGILILRKTSRKEAAEKIEAFFASENSLIFGCAGLRSLLNRKVHPGPGSLAGFLFGELVTTEGSPRFGNLMLARLVQQG